MLFDKSAPRRNRIMAAMNVFGFCHFCVMIITTTYFGTFLIVPHLFGSSGYLIYHYATIAVLVVNTAGYFMNTVLTDTSIKNLYTRHDVCAGKLLKTVEEIYTLATLTNKKCKICNFHMPARCHHCVLCGICVLKRDHHCFFACSCVGYHNQKYFIMFCFWQCLAGLYATFIGSIYLGKECGIKFTTIYHKVTYLPQFLYTW